MPSVKGVSVRALIIGATGLVGHSLLRDWRGRPGWEVRGSYHRNLFPGLDALDMLDAGAVRGALEGFQPDWVVLAASNPHVDYCETHPGESRRINVDAALRSARLALAGGARVVFFSSDYVFDGTRAPYREEDSQRPLSVYGRQKAEVESGLLSLAPDSLVLRLSGVFGWELARKNFVLQLLDRAALGLPTRAADDMRSKPTYAPDIARVLAELVESGARGVYHAAGSEELSRYEFALEAARIFGLPGRLVESVSMARLGAAAPRPPRSALDTGKLEAAVSSRMLGARQALEHMRRTQAEWSAYAEAAPEFRKSGP